MRKLLIKIFVKDSQNIKDPTVRESYGKLAGGVGIASNALLCIIKIGIGFIVNSIAIIADGINNLSDAASSIITLIGFKLASLPEDEEHPYGHARIEYITGLIVSMIIIMIGVKLLTTSIDKTINPEPLEFNYAILIVLIFSILVKIWQSLFNINIGKLIDSSTLKATGTDSRNDVIATSAVLLGIIIGQIAHIQLDGILGILVALFIIYSGIQLIRETSSPLLGQSPDPDLVNNIREKIEAYENIYGIHDLAVHNYGPGRIFASVHIEVDAHGDLIASHDLIDNIERDLTRDLKINIVAHMDPVDTKDPLTIEIKEHLQNLIEPMEGVIGLHDLRIVPGITHTNIIFDLVLSPTCQVKESDIVKTLTDDIKKIDETYFLVITFDMDYTGK